MEELKQRVESLLFSTGRFMTVEEIAKLARVRDEARVFAALQALKEEYAHKKTSLVLRQEEDRWRMTIEDKYIPFVRKVVTKTELAKGILETLAVLAYRAPMKQSDLIKIRTNKAYEHLGRLEERGFIRRKKYGRTKIITLAEKFFEYFDIPEEKLRERFQKVHSMEDAIKEREQLLKEQKKQAHENRKLTKLKEDEAKEALEREHQEVDEKLASLPEVDLVDAEGEKHALEAYVGEENPEGESTSESDGADGVPDDSVDNAEDVSGGTQQQEVATSILEEARSEAEKKEHVRKEGKGLLVGEVAPEVEEKIQEKMENLLHPEAHTEEE